MTENTIRAHINMTNVAASQLQANLNRLSQKVNLNQK